MTWKEKQTRPARGVRRMPQQSLLYDRVVPLAMVLLAGLMVVIVVLAFGILLGFVRI